MAPDEVARAITPRTKAIMAVHLYGQPCDMDPFLRLKERHGLHLIEDCAEAFGARYRGREVATLGDIATYSFFGNKTITTGEGRMVVSPDPALLDRCRRLRGQGIVPGREYWHDMIGFNFRMSNVTAAIGLAQLERADELLRRKRELAEAYFRRCAPLEFHRETPSAVHSYWLISALARSQKERDALRAHLAQAGVETRPVQPPIHTQPAYTDTFRRRTIADDLHERGLNLPSWPDLSEAELERICYAAQRSRG
jgi:perosamine synthetase